jgi:hypothetical protein
MISVYVYCARQITQSSILAPHGPLGRGGIALQLIGREVKEDLRVLGDPTNRGGVTLAVKVVWCRTLTGHGTG